MTNEHDDILGAWAIDALESDERDQVDAAVADDESARRAGDPMRRAVGAMAEADATSPPADLRAAVLDMARGRVRSRATPSSPIDAYRRQVEVFDEVVSSVAREQWQLRAEPYEWTLHGLVAHLLQIERYMERSLGLSAGQPDEFETDHLRFGADEIAGELTRSPESTVLEWRAVVARVSPQLDSVDLDRNLTFHQWSFSVHTLLIARSFELWTHTDDIRRAIDQPVAGPTLPDVLAMSDTSVRSLPLAIHVVSDRVPDGVARIVLTGVGGGVWNLELGAGGPELVSIVADAVDYCRVASRRLNVGDLDATIEGDTDLAGRLLTAATIIAV
jgi:uncharacterized protein (TIGR03083 family)